MRKLTLAIAVAAALASTSAMAGESINIVCSNDVPRGAVKLTNPPTVNCDDMSLMSLAIGSGVTVGPDRNTDYIVSQINRGIQRNQRPRMADSGVNIRRSQQRDYSEPVRRNTRPRFKDNYYQDQRDQDQQGYNQAWRDMDDMTNTRSPWRSVPHVKQAGVETCEGWVSITDILNGTCK